MSLENYAPIGEQRITLNSNSIQVLDIPVNASAATVSAYGGLALYTITGDDPTQQFGRILPNGEEVVLINIDWLRNFKIIRGTGDTTYIYVTFYQNG